ncbi:MAG TPA: SpoIIE family protein phosphatase [Flavobacteriales bacterium]|nr:SpoIIE family protein phosphatase [Flavobacteriales bacterium]
MLNKLLERQIKRYLRGGIDNLDPQVKALLTSISQSYDHYEQNRIMIERSLELSSEELNVANGKLTGAYNEIEYQNKNILDSIYYAKRIQHAILPPIPNILNHLPDCFVFYLPKDIVSGDFYWFTTKDDYIFIAACDCTGHGVPGALMSMIGNTLLNEIVNLKGIVDPGEILQSLDQNVVSSLKQKEEASRDGMDLALVRVNKSKNELAFASANRFLFRYVNNELEIIKGDKFPIGGYYEGQHKQFQTHTFTYSKGESIYIFSDGFADQFGGEHGKKFMLKQFKEFIQQNISLPMPEQKVLFEKTINDWKGSYEQVDDILVIGIRF